jgi:nucleotide-binding universal stress UspA family protein
MLRTTTILIGVDGSTHAYAALRFGSELARRMQARVVVAAAYVDMPSRRADRDIAREAEAARAMEIAEDARQALEGVGDVRSLLVAGTTPAGALHRAVQTELADLLVVGSSERFRAAGLQPGSVAEHVLVGSPCPVAVAPPLGREPAFGRIGVAVDDSFPAQAALDVALGIAASAGGDHPELELIHVAPPETKFMRPGAPRPEPERHITPPWLEAMAAQTGDRVRTILIEDTGDPARRLEQIATGLDLLVMGSRDQGGLRRLLLGSTSAHVVRHSPCPVIVVPRGRLTGAFAAPAAAYQIAG